MKKTDSENVLLSMWKKNKNAYKKKEVGNGVQKFVKEVLKNSIFKLNEGDPGIEDHKRKMEFTEEEVKKGGRADIVIFIDPEIIIPVEVEKYTKIEVGEEQLFRYQIHWQRHYGILTDGHTWRFYNNNIPLKEFTHDEVISNSSNFQTFWASYIKSENYYLSFFQDGLTGESINPLHIENNRELFFDDITHLIKRLKDKLEIEGYFNNLSDKEKGKRATEITYSYLIQFILYKTLVDDKFDDFQEKFKEIVNMIHSNLKDKHYKSILLTVINVISNEISDDIYKPFKAEQNFIDKTLKGLVRKPKNNLNEVSPWLDIFIFIKKYSFANIKNEIFGYIYENYLKEIYEDEDKGQYFTDPAVVNFMLDQIGYTEDVIKKRHLKEPSEGSLSIIDPSCGSGTFLYSAVNRIVEALPIANKDASEKIEALISRDIFGLDVSEFPLYLAEMSILMRILPIIINDRYSNPYENKLKLFETEDSVSEFIGDNLSSSPEITSFMRNEDDLKECKKSLKNNKIPRRRFDYVIGNPPYIRYNDCSKQGVRIIDLISKGEVSYKDVYGVNLWGLPDVKKAGRPNVNLWAFFTALGLGLLKDKGKLCYIIPQTLLTTGDLAPLRYHLANFTTIEKIITFNSKLFVGRGLKQNKEVPTSSLILVLSNNKPSLAHKVELIEYKETVENIEKALNEIRQNKNVKKTKVEQKLFQESINSWKICWMNEGDLKIYRKYLANSEDMNNYYDHKIAKESFGSEFYLDGGYSFDEKKVLDKPISKILNYSFPILDPEFYTIRDTQGFWPNIRKKGDKLCIGLRQGNQKYKFLDSAYKIIWSYNRPDKFYFTDKDVIWARNKYLGIGSEDKEELFYLFGLLNSQLSFNLLKNILKVENEDTCGWKLDLQAIKKIFRVPKLTKENKNIKKAIIKKVKELLSLEGDELKNYVNFDGVSMQKFSDISVSGSSLILGNNECNCPILKKKNIVENAIKMIKGKETISLSNLKRMPVVDANQQKKLNWELNQLAYNIYGYSDKEMAKIEIQNFVKEISNIESQLKRKEFFEAKSNAERKFLTKAYVANREGLTISKDLHKSLKALIVR